MEHVIHDKMISAIHHEPFSESRSPANVDLGWKDIQAKTSKELLKDLNTSESGLSSSVARERLDVFGFNTIEEKKNNPVIKFFGYFWGPIPWMIEVAAILSAVVHDWTDMGIILFMLLFNAVVGFWQEYQADNAIEQLKGEMASKARVKRDGKWVKINSGELVPGDIVRLRIGDIIPADIKLISGDYLSVDESALTGESLPVDKVTGDMAFSGSTVKHGEMEALVAATGAKTRFAETAKLVEGAGNISHFQKAVLTIGDYLIYLSLGLAVVLIISQLIRGDAFVTIFQFVLILVVAAIPVAMPAVLSVTMALGALTLSRMRAIVSRLQSIEEIAGIDILCSDKTGTLTQNKLTLGKAVYFSTDDKNGLLLAAALASPRDEPDAIDQVVLNEITDKIYFNGYEQIKFIPFNPTDKRTQATIKQDDGRIFRVTKGAPQAIIKLCRMTDEDKHKAEEKIDELALKGYRTIGIARTQGKDGPWDFLGLLPFYDPPREDSAETIKQAIAHGIDVKMVTGDNTAIAKEISRQLGLKTNIQSAEKIFPEDVTSDDISDNMKQKIEAAEGFSEVFPEHKYHIVKSLQDRGHLVAMTGDGVNDAPALKQADVGIAVSGATSAARAAASLVLTAPGLSVITKAIEEARRIFERMNSYAIYRITETIRIMFFVVLAMVVFNFYPITTIMIILLALLNDLPIMTIAYDNTWLDTQPVRWHMRRVLTIATLLGIIGVAETFGLLLIGKLWLNLDQATLQTLIYLKLAIAGHMTLFVVRSRKPFYKKPYPALPLLSAVIGTQIVAVLIVGFGILVSPLPWKYIGLVWAYCIIWTFIEDWAKIAIYNHIECSGSHHRKFLDGVRTAF